MRQLSRRPRCSPGRRFAFVLALGLIASPAQPALADVNSGQLITATVYSPGHSPSQESVSVGGLQSNSTCPTYSEPGPVQQGPGTYPAFTFPRATWAVSTVLECLSTPVHVSDVHQVIVHQTVGFGEVSATSQLSHDDLVVPSDFQDSTAVPVISSDGSNLLYYRPPRDGTDANALDEVQQGNPSPLLIDVFEGPPLAVTASASQTTVQAGSSISFSATVVPASASGLSYSWDFGGGATNSTQSSPSVPFDSAGKYNVTLEVSDAAGGGGGDTIQVTITATANTPPPPPTTTQNPPPTGPTSSSGTNVGGPPGKQSGAPRGIPGSTFNSRPTRRSDTHTKKPSHGSRRTPAAHRTPRHSVVSASASSGGQSARSGSTPAGARTGSSHTPAAARSAAPRRPLPTAAAHAGADGTLVTGELISDVTPLPADASPLVSALPAPVAAAPSRGDSGTSALAVVGLGLAVVLLLCLGAGRELRGRRSWFTPHFGQ